MPTMPARDGSSLPEGPSAVGDRTATPPPTPPSSAAIATAQALFVTFLWSTSWVLIKIGLHDLPALTFAGLRYVLAFGVLVPFVVLRRTARAGFARLTGADWRRLAVLGLVMYAFTQGAQFAALAFLPAQMVSLILSFSPAAVALLGLATLGERTSIVQWLGIGVSIVGAVLFLVPIDWSGRVPAGLAIAVLGLVANAAAAILGRNANRAGHLDPLTVTVVSMGIGSVALLTTGIVTQGLPPIDGQSAMIIAVLAVVNTAGAFTLWNHTLRTLTAVRSSVVNNTMLIQIAVLAWIFLDERPGPRQVVGLLLAALGALVTQLRRVPVRPVRGRRAVRPVRGRRAVRPLRGGRPVESGRPPSSRRPT